MEITHKILVTGATGLVGMHLLKLLKQLGFENVTATTRNLNSLNEQHYSLTSKWHQLDVRNVEDVYALIGENDVVIHLAAIVDFDPSITKQLHEVNVNGTSNIVNASLESPIKKLIHLSSIAAIGREENSGMMSEATEWTSSSFNSEYAISKYHSEMEVWRAAAEGLNVVILNPSLILGSGTWGQSSLKIYEVAAKGTKYYTSGGNGVVDVRDVCWGILRGLYSDKVKERYIINGSNVGYRELLTSLSEAFGKKPPTHKLQNWLGKILVFADAVKSWVTRKSPTLTKEILNNLNHISTYNNQKSIDELGLKYIPLHKTIEDTVALHLAKSRELLDFNLERASSFLKRTQKKLV